MSAYRRRGKKICHCCGETIKSRLDEFGDNGWSGFKVGRGKTYCFCPKCKGHVSDELQRKILNYILNVTGKK
jgi:hypothetical protein